MKTIVAIAAVLGVVFAAGEAGAASCSQRAKACMKNGGTRDVCYGAALASCKKTGSYVGPYSGKAFPADSRK